MKPKKIVLFGGSGFLGSQLLKSFPRTIIISPTHREVDLTNQVETIRFLEKEQPTNIIYAAGIAKIDAAEKEPNLTYKLNFQIPREISHFAEKNKIRFFYISTDAVFDGYGRKYIFTENDLPNARTIYGKSKLQGETVVLEASPQSCIIRLITLFGINYTRANFLTTMIAKLKNNETFTGITDQLRNPLLVDIAAQGIALIVDNNLSGIYHLGSLDTDSNYQLLIKTASKFHLNVSLIKPITYGEFMQGKSGYRKKKSVLDCTKFNRLSCKKILRTIDDSIEQLFQSTL